MTESLLKVHQLTVEFRQSGKAIDDVSFELFSGETFALVGESGSGKSITALTVLRLLPETAKVLSGSVKLQQFDLFAMPEADVCKIRGRRIAMIFQDPMTSLNPVMTIGRQIEESIQLHFNYSRQVIKSKVIALLSQVEIPEPERRCIEYPHQLSGGQLQRVMIAIALAGEPDLLIADEPTTSLDVTIQEQILKLLANIQQRTGMTLWIISHDLALVSKIASRVAVMQQGKIVESGSCKDLFSHARHPYTQKLLAALPSMDSCLGRRSGKRSPLLEVADFKVYYPIRKGIFKRIAAYVPAVDGVSFILRQGTTLALVGESGCGKTTLGKGLLNLIDSHAGRVLLDGVCLQDLRGEKLRKKRAEMQIVFQDPYSSMNPRMLVNEIIAEGIRSLNPGLSATDRLNKVQQLLQKVGLPSNSGERYPHEFSGGQRQRICIARALAVEPKLIICDEPTSALDVSVQAQIIQLLKTLQQQQGISYLFITHDLAVVAEIAHEVAVMYQGKIVELGHVEQVLKEPKHDYTKKLLQAVPILNDAALAETG